MAYDQSKGEIYTGLPSGLKAIPEGHSAFASPVESTPIPANLSNNEQAARYSDRIDAIVKSGEISTERLVITALER